MNLEDWRERLATTQKYEQEHSRLYLITLDPEGHSRTCNYWYLVQQAHGGGHSAFRTRAAALFWLEARGLRLPRELGEPGAHDVMQIGGTYRDAMWLDLAGFYGQRCQSGYVGDLLTLSNARHVVGIVNEDGHGIRTVHTLNPNVPRLELDYRRAAAACDLGGWITSRSALGVTHERAGMVPARQEGGL